VPQGGSLRRREEDDLLDLKPLPLTLCFAAALALSLLNFLTIAAVLPDLIRSWSLNKTQAGWLVGVYFAGYMSAILFVASLTDRVDPRRIYLIGAAIGGLSSLALALFAKGFWLTMVLRFMGGVAFAGVYMPGLRALTDSLPPAQRNRGIVYYSSCFALGSGFSIFAAGRIAAVLDWRWAFVVAAAGSFAAMALVAVVLRPRAPAGSSLAQSAAKPPPRSQWASYKQVWRNRRAVGYIVAMYGVGWEVFAFRSWIVTYLTERQGLEAGQTFWLSPPDVAFASAIIGIPASVWIGEWAARINRERLLIATALVSLVLDISLAAAVSLPYGVLFLLCFAFSLTSFGRSAATTAGMMHAAQDEVRGATMAAHSFMAFLSGISSPLIFGLMLDVSALATGRASWTVGFLSLAIGSAISIAGYLLARSAKPLDQS
jgi:MFS family permease